MAYTKANIRADITVGGVHIGFADAWDGGEKTGDVNTYIRVGGNKVLGGIPTRGDGKATYLYDETLHSIFRQLDASVADAGKKAVIGLTPVADDGTPFAGGGYTLTGVLKTLPLPPGDPKSADPAEVDMEFALDTEFA